MLMEEATYGFIVITVGLEVAFTGTAHVAFEMIETVTESPLFRVEVEKEEVLIPVGIPFMSH